MVFSSPTFLFIFLPAVFILNLLLRDIRLKNALLIIFSLVFYAWGEPVYVLLMILTTLINYLLSRLLKPGQTPRVRRIVLWLTVIWNIGSLVAFKYTDFLISTINSVFTLNLPLANIALPVGISFFTFQAMSYTIDVYRGECAPGRNFFDILLYISLFPQLIAGPIVKYHDVASEIVSRKADARDVAEGLRRFLFGLGKKALIANTLASAADAVYALESVNAPLGWLGAIAYLLQIYFDFSGYSDMAIGLGRMFGFHFRENFNYPYIAGTVQEFWRRWHISLSTWFKEYVYIPLGGNRRGRLRTAVNRLTVFLLTGLWHGASWNFAVWGLWHGGFLMLESAVNVKKWPRALRHVYTLLVVTVGFVVFRAENMAAALNMLSAMFTGFASTPAQLAALTRISSPIFVAALIAGILGATPLLHNLGERLTQPLSRRVGEVVAGESEPRRNEDAVWGRKSRRARAVNVLIYALSAAVLMLSMLYLSTSAYNPFIYFRF